MKKSEYVLGLDIGTSSVKALAVHENGHIAAFSSGYVRDSLPDGFIEAVKRSIRLAVSSSGYAPKAISMCGQVGTYLLMTDEHTPPEMVSWQSAGGAQALNEVLGRKPQSFFEKHINMRHPRLESYPLVRYLQLRASGGELFERCRHILSPKDYVYLRLTGEYASDPYSWRGLANIYDSCFSEDLLDEFSLDKRILPRLYRPWDAPGGVKSDLAADIGIPAGTPVYLGCNDFYAAVLGMGCDNNSGFDATGTSEHVGVLSKSIPKTELIASPFFDGSIMYGVTASSGASMQWALDSFPEGINAFNKVSEEICRNRKAAPIFLPYLNGERSPIYDSTARGVFFGLSPEHTAYELYYAVMEGVAFSAAAIWEQIPREHLPACIKVSGGASHDTVLNRLKSALFNTPLMVCSEKACGALGAAILAFYGSGGMGSLSEAQILFCRGSSEAQPDRALADCLTERFSLYKSLYTSLKERFADWAGL